MVASKHQHYYSLTLHKEITMLPTNIITSTATIILKIINTIVPIFIMISLHFSKLSTPLFPSSLFSSVFFLQFFFIVFQSIISNSKHYHVPISVLHTFFFFRSGVNVVFFALNFTFAHLRPDSMMYILYVFA